MKIKLIIISIILLLVIVFASGCIPVMEKLGLVNPANEEQLSSEKGGPSDGLVKVLIGFKEKPGAAQQAMVKGVGGKIKYTYHIVDAIAASIPEKAIDALQKNPNVRYVEPDGIVQTLDELDDSWGVKRIGAGNVHELDNRGDGVKVAIIDTGIDCTHGDLTVAGGKSFVDYTDVFDDDDGHGTHVAGIVAALDNGIGVIGVAPEVSLYALKALDSNGSGYVSDVVAAIQWATVNEIQVINMSLGGGANLTLEAACLLAYYQDGLILVASAGNSGNPPGRGDNVGYPAAYDSVIAVAATDQSDERARWSSTGPDVELAAPGVSIYSTYIGGYATYSGTSMAAPHVAGVAALVITSGTTVASDVRGKLTGTADDLGEVGWDSKYGYGLVNAAKAAAGVETGAIAGKVTDVDNSAIEGATVVVEGTTLPEEATTDENGDYTINNVPVGIYTVTASADGYENDSQENITVSADDITSNVNFTLTLSETGTMYVHNIDMSSNEATAGPNTFYTAIATVTIVDADGSSVGGATVSGHWSGATSDTDSGITDINGQVNLESSKVKNPTSGVTTFTFTVDDVAKAGWTYDSLSPKPSGSITYE